MKGFLKFIVVFLPLTLLSSNSFSAILDSARVGDTAYFLQSSPNQVARYSLTQKNWLTPVTLTETPSYFYVDDAIYVAYDRSAYSYALDGSSSAHIRNTANSTSGIGKIGDIIYIASSSYADQKIEAVNKNTSVLVDTASSWYDISHGLSFAAGARKIFGRDQGSSPRDIYVQNINPDGTFGSLISSPYHGDYNFGDQTYVSATEGQVITNSGLVFNSSDLLYAGSLAGAFDALAYWGDIAVVVRGSTLHTYSKSYLETGAATLLSVASGVFVHGDIAYAYSDTVSGIGIEEVDLSTVSSEEPGEVVNPSGLDYTPEIVLYDTTDEIVYLMDTGSLSLFRWSVATQSYLDSTPLSSAPSLMTLDAINDVVYLGYNNGSIKKIDFTKSSVSEEAFVNIPSSPHGLKFVGQYLLAADSSGAWNTHYTFSRDGTLISSVDWNRRSREYAWNEVLDRVYFFRDGTSPNDLHYEIIDQTSGEITGKGETPYHSSEGITMPIRVSPDGGIVILGSGRIYDAESLSNVNNLSNTILDAAWVAGTLYTVRDYLGVSQIQEWGTTYAVEGAFYAAGNFINLFSTTTSLLVVSQGDLGPEFKLFEVATPPDADEDTIVDYSDNCVDVHNTDQADMDGDLIGDVCDSDRDGDGIPNSYEEDHGLNSDLSEDAVLDLDLDSVTNYWEYIYGSSASSALSLPELISSLVLDFEDGALPLGWVEQEKTWHIEQGVAYSGNSSLVAEGVSKDDASIVEWSGMFGEVDIGFIYKVGISPNFCCDYFLVFVDGVELGRATGEQDWSLGVITIPEGFHTIRVEFKRDNYWGAEDEPTAWIDSIIVAPQSENIFGKATVDSEDDSEPSVTQLDTSPNISQFAAGGGSGSILHYFTLALLFLLCGNRLRRIGGHGQA